VESLRQKGLRFAVAQQGAPGDIHPEGSELIKLVFLFEAHRFHNFQKNFNPTLKTFRSRWRDYSPGWFCVIQITRKKLECSTGQRPEYSTRGTKGAPQ